MAGLTKWILIGLVVLLLIVMMIVSSKKSKKPTVEPDFDIKSEISDESELNHKDSDYDLYSEIQAFMNKQTEYIMN